MKETAKTATKTALQKAATRTGEYAGEKAGDKIIQLLSKKEYEDTGGDITNKKTTIKRAKRLRD